MPEPLAIPHGFYASLGTALIGVWVNTALFAFELTQIWRYFSVHPLFPSRGATHVSISHTGTRQDRAWVRALVLWILFLDSLASAVACVFVYGVRPVS